jgi:hypothetical protein
LIVQLGVVAPPRAHRRHQWAIDAIGSITGILVAVDGALFIGEGGIRDEGQFYPFRDGAAWAGAVWIVCGVILVLASVHRAGRSAD